MRREARFAHHTNRRALTESYESGLTSNRRNRLRSPTHFAIWQRSKHSLHIPCCRCQDRFWHKLTVWRRCPERQLLGVDLPCASRLWAGER